VWGGESVIVRPTADPADTTFAAENIGLTIVDEDDALLVIDKPAGMVVHPGSGNWDGTLQNALLHYAPQLAHIARAGIVHRLDKDTSGLLVVAKTIEAQTNLVRQLQARTVKREYLALATGDIARGGTVDAPIGRHPTRRTTMAVVATGKPARTHFEVIERFGTATLLACRLETGRTHQIRVHLASLRHPLVGDPAYGRKGPLAFRRQALHAFRLGLVHPVTGAECRWEAPLPDDLANLLAMLRARTEERSA
jgi:23S rRNA pseudouridine1911/1915/1917 synthase